MITDIFLVRRMRSLPLGLPLLLCAALMPLAACKKKEDAAAPAATTASTPEPKAPEPPKEEPPVEFKAKLPVGQRIVLRLESVTDSEFPNPLTQQPLKQAYTLVQEVAFTATKERDGGGYEVDVETLAVATTNRFGTNAAVAFTTRGDPKQDPKNNPLAAPLRKLIGSKVKYLTTADGKVEKVEGGLQLRSKVSAGANPQSLLAISALLSDDAIKGWNTLHIGLPEKPLKPKDSWTTTRNQSIGITALIADTTNTFTGWEQRDGRKVALIESSGGLASKAPAGAPAATTVEDGSTLSGKAWFDPALGVIVEYTATSEVSVKTTTAKGQTSLKAKVTASAKVIDAPSPAAETADTKPGAPAAGATPPDAKPSEAKSDPKSKATQKP